MRRRIDELPMANSLPDSSDFIVPVFKEFGKEPYKRTTVKNIVDIIVEEVKKGNKVVIQYEENLIRIKKEGKL